MSLRSQSLNILPKHSKIPVRFPNIFITGNYFTIILTCVYFFSSLILILLLCPFGFQPCHVSTWREISFFVGEIFIQSFSISSCAHDCVQSYFKYLHIFFTPFCIRTQIIVILKENAQMCEGCWVCLLGGIAPKGVRHLTSFLGIFSGNTSGYAS